MLAIEFVNEEAQAERTVRRHKSSACINPRRQSPNAITADGSPNVNHTTRRRPHRASILSGSSRRDERVSGLMSRRQPETDFKFVGSIEQYGWKAGQVPLLLEWFPEKLDRRSPLKFFESGKEYLIGRDPSCDIYFQNCEPDSGISGKHLKIKVASPHFLRLGLTCRLLWFLVL